MLNVVVGDMVKEDAEDLNQDNLEDLEDIEKELGLVDGNQEEIYINAVKKEDGGLVINVDGLIIN